MGHFICKVAGKYLVWSSIVDAPITYGATIEQLEEYTKEEYGEKGLRDLPEKLKRVEKYGTSCLCPSPQSFEELIVGNRAGENEEELSLGEIIKKYVNRE